MGQQDMEQAVFGLAERDQDTRGRRQCLGARVERPALEDQHARRGIQQGIQRQLAGAPQNHLDPCQQLASAEGLGEIVVRPQLQAKDAIELVAARRQHDDRCARACPKLATQLQTVDTWQHDVQHDEVDPGTVEYLPHGRALADAGHLQAVALQIGLQQLADLGVVVDHQDMILGRHDSNSTPARPLRRDEMVTQCRLTVSCRTGLQKPLSETSASDTRRV